MPFVKDNNEQLLTEKAISFGGVEVDNTPEMMELALATFRTENSVGSLIARTPGLPDSPDTDFNPWEHLTDEEKLDEQFYQNAMLADSIEEIDAVRKHSKRYKKDRETIANGGALSFAMGFGIGGVADPINLIPVGGMASKVYKGSSILKGGMALGSVSAAATAAQEIALHTTQLERTFGESAVNMSASFLLSGVLGMSVAKLGEMGVSREILDDIDNTLRTDSRDVSAAKTLDDVELKGKAAKVYADAAPFDPLTRTLKSKNPFTRKYVNALVENPYEMERVLPDGSTASKESVVTAVESLAKQWDGRYAIALEAHNESFRSMRKRLGEGFKETLTRKGVTKAKFNEMVSREVRNPDPKAAPEVKAAAKAWDEELYEPIKNAMIEAKLLPEDVKVDTAKAYLNRVWSKEKIAANQPAFVSVVSKWLREQDEALFGMARNAVKELKTAKGARKAELEELIKKANFKEGLEQTVEDYEDIALQIAMRISGTPDGRLPYDWKLGEGSKGFASSGTSLRGPMKNRTFNIPDELVEEFLENDIERLAGRYLRQTTPDIELAKRFDGDVELKAQEKDIERWWTEEIGKESNPKKRVKMAEEKAADLRDFAGMRDRMRGIYKQADFNNPFVRIGRAARDLNYLRFMGGVVASSIPDISRVFMAEGFANTFKHGIKPLISNLKQFKVAASEAKRYNGQLSALFGGRGDIIADVADYTQGGTIVERALRGGAEKFGKINLMDQWTASVKQLQAVTMQSSIFEGLSKGKYDKRLGRLGISKDDANSMFEQVMKHGRKDGDTWITGAKNWDHPELERMWAAAMRKESDRVIVVPGQEKPLFMSTEMGKTFMQFKSFMFSATQRVLIAGLQGQDHNYIGGMASIISLGMMAYAFKQWDAGREISDNPAVWIMEGIDRSGSLGMLMEVNNTLEKISNNNWGLRPLVGASAPASRYASRSQAEAMLGPTFGSLLETTLKVAGAGTGERPWDEKDTRTLRRLLPYQNLSLLRQFFDKLEGR